MKYKKQYLLFSVLVLIPGIVSLALYGLKLSNDFTGGSSFEFRFTGEVSNRLDEISEIFESQQIDVREIETSGEGAVIIRTHPVEASKNEVLKKEIFAAFEGANQTMFETIGPSVGAETTRKAFLALMVASVGIVLYIAFAFRNIPKPYSSYKFGISAIIAMLHDAILVIGIFSILGHFYNIQIGVLFITAILTIIGFSVHDSIVVFDRIRENLNKFPKSTKFNDVVNYSVVETLNRSLATSITVLIVLIALLLLGGASMRNFVLALVIGIASGTYSSIFTAAPILSIWESSSKKRN